MLSRAWPAPVFAKLALLATFVVGAGWSIGCAANTDDTGAANDEPVATLHKDDKDAGPSSADPNANHPVFEAGFEDAGNGDPTPDGGDTCVDKDDPGSSENTAKQLADTTDAQNDPIVVKGVLNGPIDVDFYSLKMSDTFGHTVGADLQVATASTEMCVFMKCVSGETNWSGCTQGVEQTSAIGDKGCCTSGPGKAIPSWSCGGFTQSDDSAQFYFRIKQPSSDKCLPYAFSYAF